MNEDFVIPTRQKDEELFRSDVNLASGAFFSSSIRLAEGYGSVRFLAFADQTLRLRVEESPELEGPWVETERLTSVPSTSLTGQQFICASVNPCGAYMRVFLDNTGIGTTNQLEFIGLGHPIGDGGGSGGGGGGPATNVNIKDCATDTEASVKSDGAPISPAPCDGGLLIAGRDALGFQRHIRVTTSGDLIVAGGPGATIAAVPDTAVGALATVALPVPPAGTRRMTVQNTGVAGSRIRIRQVGGPAGSGILLTSLGSTSFGGADGAIAALEAQDVISAPGLATTVGVTFEGN